MPNESLKFLPSSDMASSKPKGTSSARRKDMLNGIGDASCVASGAACWSNSTLFPRAQPLPVLSADAAGSNFLSLPSMGPN